MIVAGHRRVAAAAALGWPSVEVIVNRTIRPDNVLAAMLIENGQRKDLDPIEEARALRKIQDQLAGPSGPGSQLAVARKVGRSLSHVSGRLALLALKPVRSGEMSLTEATVRARVVSGRVRPGAIGRPAVGHLSATHPLAGRAKARCVRLGHSRGKGTGVGGIACGDCWETVIRADERATLHAAAATHGKCPLCDATTTVDVS
jgi:ParB family chromosome partitioning protein